jgi:hypothetical protein
MKFCKSRNILISSTASYTEKANTEGLPNLSFAEVTPLKA